MSPQKNTKPASRLPRSKTSKHYPALGTGAVFLEEESASADSFLSASPRQAAEHRTLIKTVLILGSGGLKIGQAGEFDYSGSQAIKALKEEGMRTVLINPNIATIQTSEKFADLVYFLPVTPEFVEQVIEKERPDGILLAFGGQTALNCGVTLHKKGVFKKYKVAVLGTPIAAIEDTEDRERFRTRLEEIGVESARSAAACTLSEARRAAKKIGYPLMVRAAYALGGRGSGLCKNEEELIRRAREALGTAPQILIEEWLGGWKEIEYEVVRDAYDNAITVCNMENMDPLGIHTGESIVVAPSQTLTNEEYHRLREISLRTISHLGIVGECNIQYALDPYTKRYAVIEVNARLSRSSALASKATGYPLAYVAAKIALGHALPDIPNRVTGKTGACFEPALDYVVVKVPRWDLKKFKMADTHLGSEMKSVGEVMAIGRSFEEALQKALRMTETGAAGLVPAALPSSKLEESMRSPTDTRIYAIAEALARGMPIKKIHALTRIDPWFLNKCANIVAHEKRLAKEALSPALLRKAKELGASDNRIALLTKKTEEEIRTLRKKWHIIPYMKQIDTLAAEYPAETNYLYCTYNARAHDIAPANKSILVLGSGPYRIGSSVEFDWCSVNTVETVRREGHTALMLNSNPETVSTDYDVCDRLYFDEISAERVRDICEFEKPKGVIISMGGQTPNNLAVPLARAKVPILGTSPRDIDKAEDRHSFSKLLDRLSIAQPLWKEFCDIRAARAFAKEAGYPVLIRPSYVLSGAAMNVAWGEEDLKKYLGEATRVSPLHPVVITKFVLNAKEIEIDAVAKDGRVIFSVLTEHIENAGVHSGDATVVLPPQRLYTETVRQAEKAAEGIAEALAITGPFNIQFLAYRNQVQVIECNVRASRSFPFVSKVLKENMVALATKAMLNAPLPRGKNQKEELAYVGVKVPQFSFSRIKGADPVSGIEMASTGEVGCLGKNMSEALLKAMLSVGFHVPKKGIFFSSRSMVDIVDFLPSAQKILTLGFKLYAPPKVAAFFNEYHLDVEALPLGEARGKKSIHTLLKARTIDLIISIPQNGKRKENAMEYTLRRKSADMEIPLITNIQLAKALTDALEYHAAHPLAITAWQEYKR